MAPIRFDLIVKILDYWVEDSIDRGFKPMKCYALIEIGNKLTLLEKEVEDE